MAKEPKISVIIPIYKVEKYLDKCVKSVTNQTYKNLEIILVDDGSPDACPQMCDDWAKKDERIKVIHKPNGGLSDARNAGLDIATGDYIGFVDSDDYIEKEMYEKMIEALIKEGASVCLCRINFVFEDGKVLPFNEENLDKINSKNIASFYIKFGKKVGKTEITTNTIMGSVCRCLYDAKAIANHRFVKDMFCEDLIFSLGVVKSTDKFCVVNNYYYNYLQRTGSILHTFNEAKYLKRKLFTQEVLKLLETMVSSEDLNAYKFHLYQLCLNDLVYADSGALLKKFKTDEFFKSLNTKQNYKAIQNITKSRVYKTANFVAYKKWFWLYKMLYKLSGR